MEDNSNFGFSIVALVIFWLLAGILFVIAHFTDNVVLETLCNVLGIVAIIMGVSSIFEEIMNNYK